MVGVIPFESMWCIRDRVFAMLAAGSGRENSGRGNADEVSITDACGCQVKGVAVVVVTVVAVVELKLRQ